MAAGVELDQLKEQLQSIKEKNDVDKAKVDRLFSEHTW